MIDAHMAHEEHEGPGELVTCDDNEHRLCPTERRNQNTANEKSADCNIQTRVDDEQVMKREIGLTVRNDLMAKEAISKGLHESEAVRNQLRAWRDKWVYQEMRQQYLIQNDLNPPLTELADSTRSAAHLKQTQLFLEQKLGLLRKTNTVQIYETVLDTISVTDFKKSRWANVFLFKNSSKRPVIPTVDPALGFWKIDNNTINNTVKETP